ncbi:MAG TPA: hypothetical protein VGK32_18220 [Vicinamibacterales bacterium]|jgi:hypothetical protein
MTRTACLVLVALFVLVPAAFADVTINSSMAMNAGGMAINGTTATKIKGTKMRADSKVMNQEMSIIVDAAARQQWMVNHTARQIQAIDPQKPTSPMPMTFGEPKISVKPNGQTRTILGQTCNGFTVEMTLPIAIGNESVTMNMGGTAWTAKSAPGVADMKTFYKAAADAGMMVSGLGQGPQGKALSEAQKLLGQNGISYEQELKITIEGTGQMAAMMSQMGNMTITLKVTSVSADPIPADAFELPAGYTRQ